MITITGTQLTCIASCTAVQSSWELLGPPLKGEVADVGATPGELGASPAVPGWDEEDRYLTAHLCRVVHRVALRAGRPPSVIARADTRLQRASNMVVRAARLAQHTPRRCELDKFRHGNVVDRDHLPRAAADASGYANR